MAKVEREMVLEVSADLYEAIHGTPKMSRTAWVSTMDMRLGKTKAGAREFAKAGEIGTHAHAMIEWDLRARLGQQPGPKPVILDKALWSFMAFEDWAKAVNLKPLLIEEVVYSEKYGFAGTMDLYAELDHDGDVNAHLWTSRPARRFMRKHTCKTPHILKLCAKWVTAIRNSV